MSRSDEALGGRLPLLAPSDLTGDQRSTYDQITSTMVPWADKAGFESRTVDGRLIGPFNPILQSPRITDAFLAMLSAETANTTLDERVREVVILTVGAVWLCEYERYAHVAVARKAGIPEEAIQALVDGVPARGLEEEERLAQRFTRQVAAERRVDDELYAEAEAAFGPRGILDILYLAGCYGMTSSILNTFRVPAPETGPWSRPAGSV